MKLRNSIYLFLLISCFILLGCSAGEDDPEKRNVKEIILGKIELSEGWAQPASRGENTQVYLNIDNGTASQDTLESVESDIATQTIIHKSVKSGDNAYSMAPAEPQIISPAEELDLKPNSLHIMLINLTKDLRNGDSLNVRLNFSRVGPLEIRVPIRGEGESGNE